jgi:hypothetical protein
MFMRLNQRNQAMNKSFAVLWVFVVAVLALVNGCASQSGNVQQPVAPGEQPGATVVHQTPPPPQAEVRVHAPGPEYAYSWIPGYWTWQGQWVWANGAWCPRPAPHVEWVPGLWAKRGSRYIWIRGHWE